MGRKSLPVIAGLLLCCVSGCGPREPKTYPLTGKIVFKGGNVEQLQGWVVQFQSVKEPDQRAVAEIGQDGRFEAVSVVSNRAKKGVVEGQNRVAVINPLNPNANVIDPRFRSFEKSGITVTVPADKDVVIEVWR